MLFKQAEPLLQFQIEADQYGADTMAVTKSVEQVLRELGPVLETEKIVLTPNLFRPADFITAGIGNLRTALTMGGVLVVLLLLPALALSPLQRAHRVHRGGGDSAGDRAGAAAAGAAQR